MGASSVAWTCSRDGSRSPDPNQIIIVFKKKSLKPKCTLKCKEAVSPLNPCLELISQERSLVAEDSSSHCIFGNSGKLLSRYNIPCDL